MPEHWYDYNLAWWETPHPPMSDDLRLAMQNGLRLVRPDGTNTPAAEIEEALNVAQAQLAAGIRPV